MTLRKQLQPAAVYGLPEESRSHAPISLRKITLYILIGLLALLSAFWIRHRVRAVRAAASATWSAPAPGQPPQLGYVASWGTTSSGVTISWSTNEAATTALTYGLTPALGLTVPKEKPLSITHGVTLSGLNSATTYYFAAESTNPAGKIGRSTIYSFTTLKQGPPASALSMLKHKVRELIHTFDPR